MNAVSESTRAPQTSAVARFYKPIPGAEQFTPTQRFFGKLGFDKNQMHRKTDSKGCPMGMELAYEREMKNLVTTVGKNFLLDTFFAGAAYTAAWFGGLVSSVSFTAYAVTDTIASHAGWLEAGGANAPTFTGTRPAITFGAASAGVKASTSIPTITFTGAGTVKGLFTVTNSTVGGTTGTMYSAGAFTSGDAPVGIGYVMTLTFSATQT